MIRNSLVLAAAALWVLLPVPACASPPGATKAEIARGHYLVSFIGCSDCHTPGHFLGKEDGSRYLGGSDVGFAIPGMGVFAGPNLTPDKTGLGTWSVREIVTALTTGRRPDGRILAPIMPWRGFSHLTPADARDIALYLKTLKPVRHAEPGPWGPGQTPSILVMQIVPGPVYAASQKRPAQHAAAQ